jgi:hypothetical protein
VRTGHDKSHHGSNGARHSGDKARRAGLIDRPRLRSRWAPSQDTCLAECRASWAFDDATRVHVWELFKNAPAPVGYDPAIIPPWKGGPTSSAFAALKLEPWRLRVMPGSVMMGGSGEVLTWRQ